MTRLDFFSVLWFVFAVGIVTWFGLDHAGAIKSHDHDHDEVVVQPTEASSLAASGKLGTLANGERGVIDANGVVVPIRPYKHIATCNTVADELVLALLEPERVVAMSEYGRHIHTEPHRYGDRAELVGCLELERLVELGVDLLVVNHWRGTAAEFVRIRGAGIHVFNLGDMRGLETLLPNITALSTLIGEPARGELYAQKLVRRMRAVAADIPEHKRKRAMYVLSYANQLFGGAKGTSYHDIMVYAGLRDVAAEKYIAWPHYDPEQIIELDPEVIVANVGTNDELCRVGGLENLQACKNDRVITLPPELLSHPGPHILEAAETLRDLVYGPLR